MNFNRIKVLFTLYIWSLIQKEYMAGGWNYFNLDDWYPKLKKDSDLPTSYNILNERNILEDLGFLKTTEKNVDVILELFDKFDVFNIEVTDKNRIRLEGEDLYNCGLWLKKQKYNWFICEHCGKEIFDKNKPLGGRPRKYCKECSKIYDHEIREYTPVYCEICGIEIEPKFTIKHRQCYCGKCKEDMKDIARNKYRSKIKDSLKVDKVCRETSIPQTPEP